MTLQITSFMHTLGQLKKSPYFESMKNKSDKISREEYDLFCKEYVFDKLKGIKFGEAFCKRFGIEDSALSILQNETFTKDLIESLEYIK